MSLRFTARHPALRHDGTRWLVRDARGGGGRALRVGSSRTDQRLAARPPAEAPGRRARRRGRKRTRHGMAHVARTRGHRHRAVGRDAGAGAKVAPGAWRSVPPGSSARADEDLQDRHLVRLHLRQRGVDARRPPPTGSARSASWSPCSSREGSLRLPCASRSLPGGTCTRCRGRRSRSLPANTAPSSSAGPTEPISSAAPRFDGN